MRDLKMIGCNVAILSFTICSSLGMVELLPFEVVNCFAMDLVIGLCRMSPLRRTSAT